MTNVTCIQNKDNLTIVDFYGQWCAPCNAMEPVLNEISNENSNVDFVKVDTGECFDLATNFEITSIPTFVAVENGKELGRIIGQCSKEDFEKWIKQFN